MRSKILVLLLIAFAVTYGYKDRRAEKHYNKSFYVEKNQPIEFHSVSGMEVEVIAWDQDSLKLDLYLNVDSSDDDYEEFYLEHFRIEKHSYRDVLKIRLSETEKEGETFLKGLLNFRIHYYFEKELRGVIYVPRNSAFKSDFQYGRVSYEGLNGAVSLKGRSNDLKFKDCSELKLIENPYGNVELIDCAGEPFIDTRSAEMYVSNFDGPLEISSDYSKLRFKDIRGNLDVKSRSGSVVAENISGFCKVTAPYSRIDVINVRDNVNISGRSETIKVKTAGGVKIAAPYCNVELADVKSPGKPMNLSTRSGTIVIENSAGELDIDDQYSNMEIENFEGNVNLSNTSGVIRCKNIKGNWESRTQYTTITIDGLSADIVKMNNKSNLIEIEFTKNPSDINIENTYGGVDLTLPSDYGAVFKLYSTYGSIRSDFDIDVKKQSSSANAFGQIGGGNGSLYVETQSADIVLRKK